MTDRIIYNKSVLYYNSEGKGNKKMLLFHGFGQDHSAFEVWTEKLKEEYTLYSFDLFFHGHSTWENRQSIKMDDWKNILLLFFEQEKIERFEIGGFSIGAKFVLSTALLFPDKIDKIILVAPDGIKKNFWYGLATGSSLMRSVFRSFILKPHCIRALVKILEFLHVEDKALLRFAEHQLSSDSSRLRVYNSWVYFRSLKFELTELIRVLNSKNIPVIFVLGKSDKIIPSADVKRFADELKNRQFYLTEASHQNLIRKAIEYLPSL